MKCRLEQTEDWRVTEGICGKTTITQTARRRISTPCTDQSELSLLRVPPPQGPSVLTFLWPVLDAGTLQYHSANTHVYFSFWPILLSAGFSVFHRFFANRNGPH